MKAGGPPIGAEVAVPPWVWLVAVAQTWAFVRSVSVTGLVAAVAGVPHAVMVVTRTAPAESDGAAFLALSSVTTATTTVAMALGIIVVVVPAIRARWVERRFRLTAPATGLPPEMVDFVAGLAPRADLRLSVQGGRYARVYAAGWSRPRLGVFRPLLSLWRSDREAAESVLAHELAHIRQGEHLVLGLGGPFGLVLRTWLVSFLLFTALPYTVLVVTRPELATTLAAQVLLDTNAALRLLVLPVAAFWLAELAADRWAADQVGSSQPLERIFRRRPAAVRPVDVLDHPPRLVRRRHVVSWPRFWILAAWPSAVLLKLVLLLAVAVPAWALLGFTPPEIAAAAMVNSARYLVDGLPLMVATTVVILGWPAVAGRWGRLWSGGDTARHGPALRPYVLGALPAAALVVAAVLGA